MEQKFQVRLKIRKPVAEVFEAVVNPDKLSVYFVQASSGPLAAGTSVKWKFAEMGEPVDVVVREVAANDRIAFHWPAAGGYDTEVVMTFTALDGQTTMVSVEESGWKPDEQGIKGSHGNAGGWMHMMCCLKAYLEYGINLRAGGAF